MMAGLCNKRGRVDIACRGYFAYPFVGIWGKPNTAVMKGKIKLQAISLL
jgi:hypothetical protein